MPICVNLWSIKNHLWSEFFLSTDYHRLSQISFLIPNSRALFPHVSDYSLQRLRFWVPTSQMYQHRTLGTYRRHGVHHHTTPFHSTASKATLLLPRRAILALWGSTSKIAFLHFWTMTDHFDKHHWFMTKRKPFQVMPTGKIHFASYYTFIAARPPSLVSL